MGRDRFILFDQIRRSERPYTWVWDEQFRDIMIIIARSIIHNDVDEISQEKTDIIHYSTFEVHRTWKLLWYKKPRQIPQAMIPRLQRLAVVKVIWDAYNIFIIIHQKGSVNIWLCLKSLKLRLENDKFWKMLGSYLGCVSGLSNY